MLRYISLISFLLCFLLLPHNLLAQEENPYRLFDAERFHSGVPRVVTAPTGETPESIRLNAFVDQRYSQYSSFGQSTNEHVWGDFSDAVEQQRLDYLRETLTLLLQNYNPAALDDEAKLTYQIFEQWLRLRIALLEYDNLSYPITHRGGPHLDLPNYLINYFEIANSSDADVYLLLMDSLGDAFDQLIEKLETRAVNGVILPRFLFPYVIYACQGMISGRPFDNSGVDSPLLADFRRKVQSPGVFSASEQATLITRAENVLLTSVRPDYQSLISYLSSLQNQATDDAGVWKLPDGDAFYRVMLKFHTTTDLSPESIHRIGLRKVKRIHKEIRKLMKTVEFESNDLSDFFEFMRTDPQFYYENTSSGKEQYLADSRAIINEMKRKLKRFFITRPQADLEVRAVEPYREQSMGGAFYTSPSLDGSRPGIFYVNLYDMNNEPKFEMQALAYHEGIPGHHLQISLAREGDFDTTFRKVVSFNGFVEGWALYAEDFPKDYGMYVDPYSDFGRLSMELWRACRLVVDTGLHYKKWTRQQAIDYLVENTPSTEVACRVAIDRYIVLPGQATSYMIGKIRIMKLRKKAMRSLGDDFQLKEYHETILTKGAMTLEILQDVVKDWLDDFNAESEKEAA